MQMYNSEVYFHLVWIEGNGVMEVNGMEFSCYPQLPLPSQYPLSCIIYNSFVSHRDS
jgi:hypothetical protein